MISRLLQSRSGGQEFTRSLWSFCTSQNLVWTAWDSPPFLPKSSCHQTPAGSQNLKTLPVKNVFFPRSGIREDFLTERVVRHRSAGVTIPECGTWGHGAGMNTLLLGAWLDSMILQLLSNFNGSVIPQKCSETKASCHTQSAAMCECDHC